MAFPELRIRPNRSPSNFLSIGTPPRPQNPTEYIQIGPIRRITQNGGLSAQPHMHSRYLREVVFVKIGTKYSRRFQEHVRMFQISDCIMLNSSMRSADEK